MTGSWQRLVVMAVRVDGAVHEPFWMILCYISSIFSKLREDFKGGLLMRAGSGHGQACTSGSHT